ncbi:MAG TPA: PHP domain-containing protein, partial [Planctomycetota bacterium]|nr:PHP domain-containing protein [Planctomycetota bacterium]
MSLRELRGAVHVHSVLSDGSGTVEEIVGAARRRGLDFVVLTDDEPDACRPELAGRYGDVLLIVGAEIGSREVPHLLALGVDDPDRLDRGDVQRCLAGIRARRGRAFVAHPRGASFLSLHMPAWTAWDSDDYVGMEVWSYMHDWIEDLRWWRLGSYVLWPERQITGPHPEVLAAWDRMTMRRHVSGI